MRNARRHANGGPRRRARRLWRFALIAIAVALAAAWTVRAALAFAGGDVPEALGHAGRASVFVAGCLAGRLIEGFRHRPGPRAQ